VLSESAARALLVLHTGLGVAAVATGTHLVIWLRRYLRGTADNRRAVVNFAWLFLGLQLAAFAAGNAMYPTYKVRVRAAYLENALAIEDAQMLQQRELVKLGVTDEPTERVRDAAQAARWFDVKEHWIALGILASAAVLMILLRWQRDDGAIGSFVLGLAAIACATTWLGAIIGVLTAAWRAV
jgi:hypothetical protein